MQANKLGLCKTCIILGYLGYQLAMEIKKMTQALARADIRDLYALGHLGH